MDIPLLDGERCKSIEEYPDYLITTMGRVWSSKSNKFLKPSKNEDYHYSVQLYNRKGVKHYHISTLVGRHFLDGYEEGMCILHNNEDLNLPEIHSIENLRLGTHKDNQQDKIKKFRSRIIKLTPIDKHFIKLVKPSYTCVELGKMYGVSKRTIVVVINS